MSKNIHLNARRTLYSEQKAALKRYYQCYSSYLSVVLTFWPISMLYILHILFLFFRYCLCMLNIYVVIDGSFSFFLSYLSDSNASHSIRLFVSLLLSISVPPCLLQLTLFHFLLSLPHIFLPSLYYFCTEFAVIVLYYHSRFFTIYFL